MAAKTPSTIQRDSAGSNTLFTINFTDLDDNDTYDSKIHSVIDWWINCTDDPTQKAEGIDAKHQQHLFGTDDTSRFTFYAGEDNRVAVLYVLAKV